MLVFVLAFLLFVLNFLHLAQIKMGVKKLFNISIHLTKKVQKYVISAVLLFKCFLAVLFGFTTFKLNTKV